MKNYILTTLLLLAFVLGADAQKVLNPIDPHAQVDWFPATPGNAGDILQINPTGTGFIYVPNVSDTHHLNADQTATGNRDHDLLTFNYRIGNSNYDHFLGNNGTVNIAGYRKVNSPTNWYQAGLADFSGFGLGDVGLLGEADLTGADATNIIVSPLLGNILMNASDGSTLNMYSHANPSSVGQLFDLKGIDPTLGYRVGFESQIDLGILKPKMYVTSNDGSTNLTVLEMTQNFASLFTDDGDLEFTQTLTDFSFSDSEPTTGIGTVFNINESGDLTAPQYPESRNDGITPVNLLHTDATGNIVSSPVSSITPQFQKEPFDLTPGQTVINLSGTPSNGDNTFIKINGVEYEEGVDYTLAGNVVTLLFDTSLWTGNIRFIARYL